MFEYFMLFPLIMRILSWVTPFIFCDSVRCTFYKSSARNLCKMTEAEKYSIAFVTINDKEAAAKLSEYEIICYDNMICVYIYRRCRG